MSDLIGRVADEIILEALLMMNDDLNSVFVRYERFVKNRDATLKQQASPQHQIPPDQQGELTTMFTGVHEPCHVESNMRLFVCACMCVRHQQPLVYLTRLWMNLHQCIPQPTPQWAAGKQLVN